MTKKPMIITAAAILTALLAGTGAFAAYHMNSGKPAPESSSIANSSSVSESSSSSSGVSVSSSASSSSSAVSPSSSSQTAKALPKTVNGLKVYAYVNKEPLFDVYIRYVKRTSPKSENEIYHDIVKLMVLSQEAEKEGLTVDEKKILTGLNKIENYAQQEDATMYKELHDQHEVSAKACGLSLHDYFIHVILPRDKFDILTETLAYKFTRKSSSDQEWADFENKLVKEAEIIRMK